MDFRHLFSNKPVFKCALPINTSQVWQLLHLLSSRGRGGLHLAQSLLTEACFVVGCSPSFSSLVSSVGVGTRAKNAQIVWFQIRGQHCNFSVTVIVTLTPHADFPTNILLSWRFCQLSWHKISLVLQTQAFDGGWNATYLKDETCIGDEKRQNRRGKLQVTKKPLRKKVPHVKKPHISFQVIPRGLKSGRWIIFRTNISLLIRGD